MKKALVVLLVSLMVGAFAFAEDPAPAAITFGAWGRVGYVFAKGDSTAGSAVTTGNFPSWADGSRVGFNVHGTSPNVGFDLNVDSNGNAIGIGDNARVWVKMFDVIKVELGKSQVDNLRGKIGDSGNIEVNSFGDEDAIFQRFYPKKGFVLELTPVEGLFIAAAVDTGALDGSGQATAVAALTAIQAGAGYTIKDVGQIRVQYIGTSYYNKSAEKYTVSAFNADTGTSSEKVKTVTNQSAFIQAAFALTAVSGLTIDLGAKVPVVNPDLSPSSVVLGVSFGADALSLMARLSLIAGQNVGFGAFVDGSYTIAAPFGLGAQVSLDLTAANAGNLDLFPYLKFGYGNGFLKFGFEYKATLQGSAPSSWSIPVVAEYWF